MSFGNALLISLLGLGVVFFALVLIMGIILLMTKFSTAAERRTAPAAAAVQAAPTAVQAAADEAPVVQPLTLTLPLAPGTAGNIKLYDTDPRTAAMLMAIVADESGIPLNELRFLSIREVK